MSKKERKMGDNDVMVSVIVLTYNHEKYIRQALDSILMQEVDFKYEILVGDDASTDGTSAVVHEYAEKYPDIIRAFVRKENMGATNNLYDLFQRARGAYIANCEGDDYWTDPGKLQVQVNYLQANPDYSACTHKFFVVDENGCPHKEQSLKWICDKEIFTLRDFKGLYLPGQAATLVHRNFFMEREHDYSVIYSADPIIADRTVILILALMGPIRRLPNTMSCYRKASAAGAQNATTLAFSSNRNVNRMQLALTQKLEQFVKKEYGRKVHFTRFKMEQRIKMWIRLLYGGIFKWSE